MGLFTNTIVKHFCPLELKSYKKNSKNTVYQDGEKTGYSTRSEQILKKNWLIDIISWKLKYSGYVKCPSSLERTVMDCIILERIGWGLLT